jgi:hypothetical protein
VFAAFLPLLLSFGSALRPSVKPGNARHFFLYDGGLDTGKFVTGTVGYSMQVASIYLFLLWFKSYGLWSFSVPLAWFAGYVLLAILVRLKLLDRFLTFQSDTVVTIHGYVAEAFAGRRWLAIPLAITSICGLGGTMLGEIDYALTYYVFPAITVEPPTGGYAVIVFVSMLLTAGSYIMWGGFKAAIDTDIFQVKFAYILIGVVIGGLLLGAAKSGNWPLAAVIAGIVLAFCLYAANRRVHLFRIDPTYETHRFDMGIFYALAAIVVVAVVIGFFLPIEPRAGIPIGKAVFAASSSLSWGFGVWGFVALMVTNALWQLIDISSLQRLQSLKFDSRGHEEHKKLSSGLIAAGVEGMGSWCLVLVLAILTKASGVDSPNILSALSGVWFLLVPAFIYVVTAFMLSTLDTLIAASGYVFHYDGTRYLLPDSSHSEAVELRWARFGTMSCLILVGFLYYGIRTYYSDDPMKLSTIVYAIYAIQASILGPVLVALFAPADRRNAWFSLAGVLAGWVASYYTTIGLENPLFGMPQDSWYVFPPFAALAVSTVISFIGCLFTNRKAAELKG